MTATQLKATTRFVWGPDKDETRDSAAYARGAAALCARIAWSLDTLFSPATMAAFHEERTVGFDPEGFVPESEREACLKQGLAVLAKTPQAELLGRLDAVDMQIDGWHDPITAGKGATPTLEHHGLSFQDREWVYINVGGVIVCGHPYGLTLNGAPVLLNMPDEPGDSRVRLYAQVEYAIEKPMLNKALGFAAPGFAGA